MITLPIYLRLCRICATLHKKICNHALLIVPLEIIKTGDNICCSKNDGENSFDDYVFGDVLK